MAAGALGFEKPEWGGHKPAITPNLARPVEHAPFGTIRTDVLVIGAGVLGSCLGYYLSKAGQDVTVVDRDDVNLQASGANAGSLHVQLLSFDFGAKAQEGGGPAAATLPLGPMSVRLWQEIEADCGEDLEIKITGGLMVADSEAGMRFIEAKAALERSHGIDAQVIDGSRTAPPLAGPVRRSCWAPSCARWRARSIRCVPPMRWRRRAQQQGARFLRGCDVQAIERLPGDGAGFVVRTSRGTDACRAASSTPAAPGRARSATCSA